MKICDHYHLDSSTHCLRCFSHRSGVSIKFRRRFWAAFACWGRNLWTLLVWNSLVKSARCDLHQSPYGMKVMTHSQPLWQTGQLSAQEIFKTRHQHKLTCHYHPGSRWWRLSFWCIWVKMNMPARIYWSSFFEKVNKNIEGVDYDHACSSHVHVYHVRF